MTPHRPFQIMSLGLGLLLAPAMGLPLTAQPDRRGERPEHMHARVPHAQEGPERSSRSPERMSRESHDHGREREERFEPRHRPEREPTLERVEPRSRFERSPAVAPAPQGRWEGRAPMAPPVARHESRESPRGYPTLNRSPRESRAWLERGEWRRGAWQPRATWRDHRSTRWEADHRTWSQRGGYGGYCIPRDQYQRWFGDRHWFRFANRPVMYMGYPRFWYRDFWFTIVDPWPGDWGEDWFWDDDLYVDYAFDGYYLHSRRHPGVSLAIAISI